jgi:hypothetical protein
MASTLDQPNGTHHPITVSAARINKCAASPPSQTPETGYSPVAGTRPKSRCRQPTGPSPPKQAAEGRLGFSIKGNEVTSREVGL